MGAKSPALPSERELPRLPCSTALWLLSQVEAELDEATTPLILAAAGQALQAETRAAQVEAAVAFLELNERLYMLPDEQAAQRRLRLPLLQLLHSLLAQLLPGSADDLLRCAFLLRSPLIAFLWTVLWPLARCW